MTEKRKSCPDCGGELGALSHLTGEVVAFCLDECYEKKPEVDL